MNYKLFRKTKDNKKFQLISYCYSIDYANKLIELYKKRKIIRLGEKPELNKNAKWKVIPISRIEAMMAEKDVPF